MLGARMLKRSAIIAPLNDCGLSLTVSGQIVFAAPFVDDFLFSIIDPLLAFLDFGRAVDPATSLPPKRSDPDPRGWFDPTKPPAVEPKHDWLLEVVNVRYVAVCSSEGAFLFGELSGDKTAFFWWKVALVTKVRDPGTPDEVHLGSKFNWDHSMSDDLLNFQIEETTEAHEEAAKFALANPTTKISLNVNLALKIALRRLLYIDPRKSTRLRQVT